MSFARVLLTVVFVAVIPGVALGPSAAQASGVDAPPGMTGLAQVANTFGSPPHTWRVGVDVGAFWSELRFDNGVSSRLQQTAVTGVVEFVPLERVTFQLVVGSLLGGTVDENRHSFGFQPGWIGGGSVSYALVEGRGARPFVLVSVGVVASSTVTSEEDGPHAFHGLDARLSLAVGKTFFRIFSPYAVARGFLGSATWERLSRTSVGTDVHHFQLGAGAHVRVWEGLDVFAEGAPLGEQRVTGGVGYTF